MKIEFANGTTEYVNGDVHWHEKDQPFDVDARVGEQLIATGHFQQVEEKEAPKKKEKK